MLLSALVRFQCAFSWLSVMRVFRCHHHDVATRTAGDDDDVDGDDDNSEEEDRYTTSNAVDFAFCLQHLKPL